MKRFIFLAILFLTPLNATADSITLKSGEVIEGRIVAQTPIYVRVQTNEKVRVKEYLNESIDNIVIFVSEVGLTEKSVTLDELIKREKELQRPYRVSIQLKTDFLAQEISTENIVIVKGEKVLEEVKENLLQAREKPLPERIQPDISGSKSLRERSTPIIPRGVNLFGSSADGGERRSGEYIEPSPIVKSSGWVLFAVTFILFYIIFFTGAKPLEPEVHHEQKPVIRKKITELIGMSIARTKVTLFQPFSMKKWLRLIFVSLLAGQLFSGGGEMKFNKGPDSSRADISVTSSHVSRMDNFTGGLRWDRITSPLLSLSFGDMVRTAKRQVGHQGTDRLFMILFLAFSLISFLLFLVFVWLNSRFQFVWFEDIINDESKIVEPFKKFKKEGNALFRFNLMFMFVSGLFFVFIAAVLFLTLRKTGIFQGYFDESILSLMKIVAAPMATFVLYGLITGVAYIFISHFIVPMMGLDNADFKSTSKKFICIYRKHRGPFWGYLFILLGLGIITGILVFIIAMVVGIGLLLVGGLVGGLLFLLSQMGQIFAGLAFLIGIPLLVAAIIIVMAIALPFAVFFRNFSLYYLSNLNCGYAPLSLSEEEVFVAPSDVKTPNI